MVDDGTASRRARGPRDLALTVAMAAVACLGRRLVAVACLVAIAVGLLATDTGTAYLASALAALALALLAPVLSPVLVDPAPPGVAIMPGDEPELAALVAEVARRMDVTAPLLLRAVPDVDAGLAVTRLAGRRAEIVLLGMPLLRALPAGELAAIVAHELGHRGQALDRRSASFLAARDLLATSLDRPGRLRRRLGTPLLAATRARAWAEESHADARAAAVVGTPAARRALATSSLVAAAFEQFATGWVEFGEGHPPDLYDALDAVLAEPVLVARLRAQADALDALDPGPAGSHPQPAARAAALEAASASADDGAGPGPDGGWPVPLDSPVPLRGGERLAARCALMLSEDARLGPDPAHPSPGRHPVPGPGGVPGSWGNRPGPEVERIRDRAATARRLLSGPVAPDAVPAGHAADRLVAVLDLPPERDPDARLAAAAAAVLERIATGRAADLPARLLPDAVGLRSAATGEAGLQVLALLAAAVTAARLREAGWQRAGALAPDVLRDPAGELVDVQAVLWRALHASSADLDAAARLRDAVHAAPGGRR